ncbi:hypothetical protein HMPREF0345_0136 [Enterococcus faecalis ATCC 29200]|uniref:Uncharacterized protein n=1 Tax=Enterococcus faecalis TX0630 TaxID=749508 RepID=A0ABC9P6M2_ENTFL|nr:hypothetical protein HMPREF0345_0136 [Enterococcus faecalis ATCC 29200]EFQ14546.1 hypothetical protein HMPREF9512_03275 [Enterococcus faecalis EnGen0311]EFT98671.1 hypothetical protein HMPREF9503_02847 [Enterococcus faecalis TX0043]EFU05259.1 hypothetical protein HMPREF9513_02207 [Enterococcus faecalis TX0645]EFU90696.1 hypothetical protein HMPREF9511_01314 [Enterococcus faecalis TX0630]
MHTFEFIYIDQKEFPPFPYLEKLSQQLVSKWQASLERRSDDTWNKQWLAQLQQSRS